MRIHPSKQPETRRRGVHPVCVLVATLLFLPLSGCSALQGVRDYIDYNDAMDDFAIGWRNHVWANQAWKEREHTFADQPQNYDFGEGFRAGYRAVASGGDGCPPPLPPRKYWSWKYSSPEGQAKTAAWFAGYPYGVAASEEDGAGLWREIQVSEPIAIQYSPEFHQAGCACCTPQGDPGIQMIVPPANEEIIPLDAPMSQLFNGTPDPRAADSVLISQASLRQPDRPQSLDPRLAEVRPEINFNQASTSPWVQPQVRAPARPVAAVPGGPTSWPSVAPNNSGAPRQADSMDAGIQPEVRPVRTPGIY